MTGCSAPRHVGAPIEALVRRDDAEVGRDVEDDAAAALGHGAAKDLRAQHGAGQADGNLQVPLLKPKASNRDECMTPGSESPSDRSRRC